PSSLGTQAFCQLGQAIYEEFEIVVVLKEQMRVTDHVWRDFLDHLRHGFVQQHHVDMLRTLLITKPEAAVDFSTSPWNESSLFEDSGTSLRSKKHAQDSRSFVFQCPAEDRIKGEPLTLANRYAAATRNSGCGDQKRRNQDLPDMVEIFIGMKVMVTQNIQTDLDIQRS
ncbi:hypothetical protein BJ138DRAFT_1017999, partial [Hygrophoropsis aurantiaca]